MGTTQDDHDTIGGRKANIHWTVPVTAVSQNAVPACWAATEIGVMPKSVTLKYPRGLCDKPK